VSRSSKPPTPDSPDDDRPTIVPPYDVEEMARRARSSAPVPSAAESEPPDNETPTVIPPGGPETFRAQARTLSNEQELEAARLASMRGSQPPSSRPAFTARWSTSPAPRDRPGDDPVIEIIDSSGQVEEARLDPIDEARVLADSGDEASALAILEEVLRSAPSNAPARQLAEDCERILGAKYIAQLGSLERIPKIAVPLERLVSLSLDHRAGFLLSLVDGISSLALILDLSGMSSSEVLGTFVVLKERGIITLR
jgi:hypothetical protein